MNSDEAKYPSLDVGHAVYSPLAAMGVEARILSTFTEIASRGIAVDALESSRQRFAEMVEVLSAASRSGVDGWLLGSVVMVYWSLELADGFRLVLGCGTSKIGVFHSPGEVAVESGAMGVELSECQAVLGKAPVSERSEDKRVRRS